VLWIRIVPIARLRSYRRILTPPNLVGVSGGIKPAANPKKRRKYRQIVRKEENSRFS
jgi:hypothetical protein